LVREYQQYIGGEWVSSGNLFDDLDPYRGTVMARVPAGTRADAARAVDAAAAAFPGWAELPPAEKQAMFLRAADIVERRQAEITRMTSPTGRYPQLAALGGVKDCGWGRSGPASMTDFTEIQWITTRDGTGTYPI
jgi:acyl-CoA reductase-like NAD-dependent aldehyde dehydrogenase